MNASMVDGRDGPEPVRMARPVFEIRQRADPDGTLRLTLHGELDLAVTDRVAARLRELGRSRRAIRLDLSELEFIDCTGVGAILGAVVEARREQRTLEVDELVSPGVGRITRLDGIASILWPESVPAALRANGR